MDVRVGLLMTKDSVLGSYVAVVSSPLMNVPGETMIISISYNLYTTVYWYDVLVYCLHELTFTGKNSFKTAEIYTIIIYR